MAFFGSQKSSYEDDVRKVKDELEAVKVQIRRLNAATGLLANNRMYGRLHQLLGNDHLEQYEALQRRHGYSTGRTFQRDLRSMYTKHLEEWRDFLAMVQGNLHHGVYTAHMKRNWGLNRKLPQGAGLQSRSMDSLVDEAPEAIIDPLSFNVFHDPVITPSGISYERAVLLQHLRTSGTDPLTRQPLLESQVYPNMALRDVAADYLASRR